MKFAVIGAGGIGCYYAARLIKAGEEVTLVARGEHLCAMQSNKLVVKHADFEFKQKVTALDLDNWLSNTTPDQVDVIIICLKGMQTAEFTKHISNWFKNKNIDQNKPLILSLQNGVENEKLLIAALPDQFVLGGIARRIGAHIVQPGIVEAVGPAQVILGFWPNNKLIDNHCLKRIEYLSSIFNAAKIPTEISADINKELWRKLIINSGVNPLCALLKIETGKATENSSLQPLIRGAMDEAALAATAEGVLLSKADVDEMFELISTFDSIKPSMLVDREKGRQLEIEEICGVIIKACQSLGKDAPYNRCISTLLSFELSKDKLRTKQ